jgi:hypothetical protein
MVGNDAILIIGTSSKQRGIALPERRRTQEGNLGGPAETALSRQDCRTACAAWRPSRIAQTIRDWPRPQRRRPEPMGVWGCVLVGRLKGVRTRGAFPFEGRLNPCV